MAKKPIFDNQNINLPEGKQYKINDEAISASVTEMNLLEGAVVGTVVNSKAVIYDAAGKVALSSLSPMATGTIIADATELTAAMNAVTGATGTNGVKLPVAIADEVITIINTDGANDLLVYPVLLSQINVLGASNPFTVVSGMTATFVARSATLWYTAGMPSVVSGLTASGTELNVLGGVTAGMVTASKGLVVDASKDISALNDVGLVNLDAGSSGVAGSVDVFPTTAASGKTTITSTDNAGDTTTDVVVAAQAGARTITIPDGGNATANVLLSEGTTTIAGVQTYTAPQVIDTNTTITAFAGGGAGSAVALTGEYNNITIVATDFDSVKLLTAVVGQVQTVKNSGATILSVFPNTSDSINALAVDLSVDIPVGGEMTFRAISDTVWETKEVIYLTSPTTQTGGLGIEPTANASNVDVTITNASHGQATSVTIGDSGLATSYVVQSTNILTVAEVDVLENATAGAQVASKVVVADANINTGISKVTELHIGATGSEVQVNATPAEIDKAADLSTQIQTIVTSGAQTVTAGVQALYLNEDTTAINATIATAVAHQGLFLVKSGLEPATVNDHVLTLTIGTFNGTNNVATFADINDSLLIYFDAAGAGTVLVNTGTVVLS